MHFRTTSIIRKRNYSFFAVVVISSLLSACGSVPTVRDSQRLSNLTQKLEKVQFVYQSSELRVIESTTPGPNSPFSLWDNGFHEFGDFLIKQAASAFSSYGIKVVSARKIGSKDTLGTSESNKENGGSVPIFIVFASSGKLSANSHATVASYVFEARLMDFSAKRVIWRATIDTSTWSGRDFVLKNAEKTLYDVKYADQLLKTLTERMKQDGIF